MITPESLAKSNTEHGHQTALFCWCNINKDKYPELQRLFHIQNASSNRSARVVGVKAGVPDLMLPIRRGVYSGLLIELKRPGSVGKKAGKVSDVQNEWITFLKSQGYGAIICVGWEEARDILIGYLEFK